MNLFDCFTASGLAATVFLMIFLVSLYWDALRKTKPYRKPSSEAGRGLKPEQVFPESKVVDTLDAPKKYKGII